MIMYRYSIQSFGLAVAICLAVLSVANGVEPRRVGYLLFSDPPIQNPVPPKVQTTGRSIVPVFDAGKFVSLPASGKSLVLDEMFRFVEDKQLYDQIQPGSEAVLPAEFVEPLLAEAISHPERSAQRRRILSLLTHCPAESVASGIWDAGKNDPVVRPLIEKMLMKWNSDVAATDWRAIIADPTSLGTLVTAAANGLASVGNETDAEALIPWLSIHQADQVRLAAGNALAKLRPQGNLELATVAWDPESESSDITGSLVAATLLQNDKSIEAAKLLASIALAKIDGSHEFAFLSLLKQQPRAAAKLAFQMIEDGNSRVRRRCISFIGVSKAPNNLLALFGALNDPIPENRSLALRELLKFADDAKIRSLLVRGFQKKLADDDWRTVEQAILGSVTLQNKATIPIFVKLVDHPNPNVNVTAAWGIKEMADNPKVIDWVSQRVKEGFQRYKNKEEPAIDLYNTHTSQLYAQLMEILGKHSHQASKDIAQEVAGEFSNVGLILRASSMWTLGKIVEDNPPAKVLQTMLADVKSLDSQYPVPWLIAYAAMVNLGRFGDSGANAVMEVYNDAVEGDLNVGAAATWALGQINSSSG